MSGVIYKGHPPIVGYVALFSRSQGIFFLLRETSQAESMKDNNSVIVSISPPNCSSYPAVTSYPIV